MDQQWRLELVGDNEHVWKRVCRDEKVRIVLLPVVDDQRDVGLALRGLDQGRADVSWAALDIELIFSLNVLLVLFKLGETRSVRGPRIEGRTLPDIKTERRKCQNDGLGWMKLQS